MISQISIYSRPSISAHYLKTIYILFDIYVFNVRIHRYELRAESLYINTLCYYFSTYCRVMKVHCVGIRVTAGREGGELAARWNLTPNESNNQTRVHLKRIKEFVSLHSIAFGWNPSRDVLQHKRIHFHNIPRVSICGNIYLADRDFGVCARSLVSQR